MPIYEYTCQDCGASFEAMVPMARRDKTECTECGSKKTARLASTFCCSVEGGTGAAGSSGRTGAKSAPSAPACGSGG
jgi:putative FmdB family regulatory protein